MREAIYDLFAVPRKPRDLPDLVPSHDFEELVWENGTLLMRGRGDQNKDNNLVSSSAYDRFSDNDLVGREEENYVLDEKAARLGVHNSVFLFAAVDTSKPNARIPRPCQAPATSSFLRPGVDWNHKPSSKNGFSKPSSRSPSGEMSKVNFSHFLGLNYPLVNASKDPGSGTGHNGISPMKVEMDKLKEEPMDSQKHSVRSVAETETDALKAVSSTFRAGGGDFLVPDEHSQAVGSNFIGDCASQAQDTSFDDDHQVPSPDSSIEASSSPPRLKRTRFDESESSDLEEDEDEEMVDHARESTGTKRSCPAFHDLAEKKRRHQIDRRIRALQELLPNCDKVDKASVLDEAIEYMKTLQLQLQMMSTGNPLFGSPMAMFPGGIHQMPMPYLNHLLSPLGTGMGMRMGPCFAYGHQFPLHGPNPTALAGGFRPIGCNLFTPVLGGNPALRPLINGVDFSGAAATTIEKLGSAPLSGSNESNKSRCFSEVGQKLEL